MKTISALVLVLTFGFGLNAHAVKKLEDCQGYLLGISEDADQKIYRDATHKRFATGMDDDEDIAAYVGISHEMMVELVKTGQIDLSGTLLEFEVNLTLEHPDAAQIIEKVPMYERDNWDRKSMVRMATFGSEAFSAYSLVLSRLERNQKILSEDVKEDLFLFINAIDLRDLGPKQTAYSPNFDELQEAAYRADIPYQNRKGKSLNSPLVVGKHKLLTLAKNIGLENKLSDLKDPTWRLRFELIFASLPVKEGYVLGVGSDLLEGITDPHTAAVKSIGLGSIIGIEPLSNEGFSFLDSLGKQ